MIKILLRMAIVALGLYIAATFVPGVVIDSAKTLILAALVLGVVNAVVRPIVVLLTLPVTILTLGLFIFVVNALLFWGVGTILPGFHVSGFVPALIGSIVVGLTSLIGNAFVGRRGRRERYRRS